MKKERNNSIDFFRGIAFLAIILIHTAFWSGSGYLELWFRCLFLLVDVPLFMFISGISYNYVISVGKNIKGILKQWNKWIFFILFYILAYLIFFRSEFRNQNILEWFFYNVPGEGPFKVLGGSLWFVGMYIKVSIICSIIIYFLEKAKYIEIKHIIFLLLLISITNYVYIDPYITIYAIIYLLGYYAHTNKIESVKKLLIYELIAIIGTVGLFYFTGYGIADLQTLKFPPTVYYLAASMPSILLVWYLKDKVKIGDKNPINYLGKNAIFFYYAQGISSSLLYFIMPYITIGKGTIKFAVMALINAIMAIVIGFALNELYQLCYKYLKSYKDKCLKKKN